MEPRPEESQDVYSIPEVAKRLGLCTQSAYSAAARGEIPAKKIGRRWVVPIPAFEQWLGRETEEHDHTTTWPHKRDAGELRSPASAQQP